MAPQSRAVPSRTRYSARNINWNRCSISPEILAETQVYRQGKSLVVLNSTSTRHPRFALSTRCGRYPRRIHSWPRSILGLVDQHAYRRITYTRSNRLTAKLYVLYLFRHVDPMGGVPSRYSKHSKPRHVFPLDPVSTTTTSDSPPLTLHPCS